MIDIQEDSDRTITIGDREDYIYLKTILNKFTKYDYIYLKYFISPHKVAMVNEFFHYLKWLGVREIEPANISEEPNKRYPTQTIQILIRKWELIPRLIGYRQDNRKQLIKGSIIW